MPKKNNTILATDKMDVGIYLDRNGDKDSVKALLTYCKLKNYPTPELDERGWELLQEVINNFNMSKCHIESSFDMYSSNALCSNCIYTIKNWNITDRRNNINSEKLRELLHMINHTQPKKDCIKAKKIDDYCDCLRSLQEQEQKPDTQKILQTM